MALRIFSSVLAQSSKVAPHRCGLRQSAQVSGQWTMMPGLWVFVHDDPSGEVQASSIQCCVSSLRFVHHCELGHSLPVVMIFIHRTGQ